MANGSEAEGRERRTEGGDVGSWELLSLNVVDLFALFFLCTKFILKTNSSGATRVRSLCFIRTEGKVEPLWLTPRIIAPSRFSRQI